MGANIQQPQPLRQFSHPLWEHLMRTHVASILLIYLSAALFFFYRGAVQQHSLLTAVSTTMLGLFIWTLTEYIVHRFGFHSDTRHEKFQKFQFFMHGAHHVRPTDPTLLLLPLILTLPITILSYVIFQFTLGIYGQTVFAGFIVGYVIYDITHYTIHRFHPKTRIGKYLKYYHFRHHFKAHNRCYGVTNPLWDLVCRTYQR